MSTQEGGEATYLHKVQTKNAVEIGTIVSQCSQHRHPGTITLII
jgi:hypothetical protein